MPSTLEEFMAAMESLAEDVEPLPRDFSREDIYSSRRLDGLSSLL